MGTKTPWGETGKPGQGIDQNAKDPGPVPDNLKPATKLGSPPFAADVLNDPEKNRAIAAYEQLERADDIYREAIHLYRRKQHEYEQAAFYGKPAVKPYFGASFAAALNNSNLTEEVKAALPFASVAALYVEESK